MLREDNFFLRQKTRLVWDDNHNAVIIGIVISTLARVNIVKHERKKQAPATYVMLKISDAS